MQATSIGGVLCMWILLCAASLLLHCFVLLWLYVMAAYFLVLVDLMEVRNDPDARGLLIRLVFASLRIKRSFGVHMGVVYQYDSPSLFVHVLFPSGCGSCVHSEASDVYVFETRDLVWLTSYC